MNKKGESLTQISKRFGIARGTLRFWMRKEGYIIRNMQNKLNVRGNLFQSIRTEEDAYWLGFIYADGYISDKGVFELSLKYTDYDHLLKFADYCGFDKGKVVKKQKTNFPNSFRCRLGFATKHLVGNFTTLGIVPRKSLTITYPTFLKKDLTKHFIRGYFDGDGCISKIRKPRTPKHKSRDFSTNLLGTKEFLESWNEISIIGKKNIHPKNGVYSLTYNSKEAFRFLEYLYKDSSIYLDRKFKQYTNSIAPLYSDIQSGPL